MYFFAAQPAIALFPVGVADVVSGPLIVIRQCRIVSVEQEITLEEKEPVKPSL